MNFLHTRRSQVFLAIAAALGLYVGAYFALRLPPEPPEPQVGFVSQREIQFRFGEPITSVVFYPLLWLEYGPHIH